MGTGNVTHDPFGTQATAGYAPTAGTMPGTQQQFEGHTGPTAAYAPPAMGQPDQRLHNNTQGFADPRLEPTTGQKISVSNILSIV